LAFAHHGAIALDVARAGDAQVFLEPPDVHTKSPATQFPADRAITEHERIRRIRLESEPYFTALTRRLDAHQRILPQPLRRNEPSPPGGVQLDVRLVEGFAIP